MSNQEQSAFDANSSDHEYFASSTEEINVGRGTVTELKTEPPHVYDIVWNMDLNTALTGIKVPYVIDAQEEQHKQGATSDSKVYTLSTEDSTKDIDLTQVITSGQVTELKYNVGGEIRTVTASNETDCITAMAKLLSTNGTIVTTLAADGTGDVGSTLTIVVTAAVSSGVGNSLKLGSQDIAITAFMTSMKGVAGVTKWYDADSYNDNSVTSQVRNGLAQLFDRDPQLNNLLGSSATSSTFLDSSKIATKLQNNVDDFYLKMFSEQQLREVLEAVYDRGERISGANDSDKLFTFTAGDSITAVVRVVDSDSDSNSDRWLVTLQHTI